MPDAGEIARIERDHCLDHPAEAADLAIVFGNRIAVAGMAQAAASLFLKCHVPRLLVTGGATPGGPGTEASVIADAITALGVPRQALILEHQATHTGENVTLSLPLLAAAGLLSARRVFCMGLMFLDSHESLPMSALWRSVTLPCSALYSSVSLAILASSPSWAIFVSSSWALALASGSGMSLSMSLPPTERSASSPIIAYPFKSKLKFLWRGYCTTRSPSGHLYLIVANNVAVPGAIFSFCTMVN